MKKLIAAGALAAGIVGLSACAPGVVPAAQQNYCVNQVTGQVMDPTYCMVGNPLFNPMLYDFWVGNTYGHSYHVGMVIQKNYFVGGTKVSPTNAAARKAAGIPVSGKVANGARSSGSIPARPGTAPVSGKSTTGTTTTTKVGGFSSGSKSYSTNKSSSFGSFKSGGSSSFGGRSSFGSFGGRK